MNKYFWPTLFTLWGGILLILVIPVLVLAGIVKLLFF